VIRNGGGRAAARRAVRDIWKETVGAPPRGGPGRA